MEKSNVFISFDYKKSNEYKEKLVNKLIDLNIISDYSEKDDKSKCSDEEIWKNLKKKISGSSVMIVVFSKRLVKDYGGKGCMIQDKYKNNSTLNAFRKEGWVYKEIKCALRQAKNNFINGVLLIVPDSLWNWIYSYDKCSVCNAETITLNKSRVPEIIYNNHSNINIKHRHSNCPGHYDSLYDSYIPIIKTSFFEDKPKFYIDLVKAKREKANEYDIVKK